MAKYSFILPAYKAQFFHEAIDSILAQTYRDFELIIVNDASPENLDSIINSFHDDRITYYTNVVNIGGKNLVAQWNHCLEFATGEYIILASDDDVYSPLFLEKMNELVCKYPDVNVFRPKVQFIDDKGKIGYCGWNEKILKERISYLEFLQAYVHCWICSGIPFYVFKKSSLINIGGFASLPLAWFSDDATVIKLIDSGIAYSSDVLFSFRMSGENITTKQNTKDKLKMKLEATKLFYEMIKTKLDKFNCVNEFENWILLDVKNLLPTFMCKDKVFGQIFNAPFSDVVKIFPLVYKMEFVSLNKLLFNYLKYIVKKVASLK